MIQNYKLKGPWRITFDTNPDLCNLHCIMCEERSKYKMKNISQNRLMDFKIIKKVIKTAIKYGLKEVIPSTMGEPLLYQHFEELIELIERFNLKLNLTTNGTFPKLGVDKWGKLIIPVASDIKISINGTSKETAESIMEGINFNRQIENIKKLIIIRDQFRKAKINDPKITFQATFMESNLKELPEILNLAIELDIDRFKGHHLWITHPELSDESLRRDDESIRRWNQIVKKLYNLAERKSLKNGQKIKLENIYELNNLENKEIVPNNWICPFLGREAWIAWDGTFNVCCAPNELRKTLGIFGSVQENDFIDLWNKSEYNSLISNWGKYEVCSKCNMRKPLK
ncbi:MAG: radical SAM protein [Candidatus Lokiarchaeia archaeon]